MSLPEKASKPSLKPQSSFKSLCGDWPEELLACFRDQSQLDFDLGFFECILERDSSFVDVLRCQGELLSRKGEHDRALAIDRRLAVLLPEDPVVQYNLACSLAQVGESRAAIAALRQAVHNGYRDLAHLETESDLDGLRREPEYRALLSELRAAGNVKDSGC